MVQDLAGQVLHEHRISDRFLDLRAILEHLFGPKLEPGYWRSLLIGFLILEQSQGFLARDEGLLRYLLEFLAGFGFESLVLVLVRLYYERLLGVSYLAGVGCQVCLRCDHRKTLFRLKLRLSLD